MRILNKNESTSATKSERNSINESKNQKVQFILCGRTGVCIHLFMFVVVRNCVSFGGGAMCMCFGVCVRRCC